MQTQQSQSTQKIILLPTKSVPREVAAEIADFKDFSVRFINGYRNTLQLGSDNKSQWRLTENENYCGQAFCYLLNPNVSKEELIKKELPQTILIKEVNDQMFIVQSGSQINEFSSVLTQQQIKRLLGEVTESKQKQKLALNLLKNAFNSYQAFRKSVGQSLQVIEKQINESSNEQKIPTVAQTITIELEAKKLHGDMVKKLPKCNQQTGDWNEKEEVEIKLSLE